MQSLIPVPHPGVVAAVMAVLVAIAATAMSGVIEVRLLLGWFLRV